MEGRERTDAEPLAALSLAACTPPFLYYSLAKFSRAPLPLPILPSLGVRRCPPLPQFGNACTRGGLRIAGRLQLIKQGVGDNKILMPNNHSVTIDDLANGTYAVKIACQISATVKLIVNMDKDLPGSSGELPPMQLVFESDEDAAAAAANATKAAIALVPAAAQAPPAVAAPPPPAEAAPTAPASVAAAAGGATPAPGVAAAAPAGPPDPAPPGLS